MGATTKMKDRVLKELERIQQAYDVRVLLAVESGSRAWGFASPDSDYDVRFIYVHRPDWYLTVHEQRDVIEEMLPDALDVSGWELRKTLRLFAKCNLALNEWLGSPIVYTENAKFKAELSALVPQFFNPIAAMNHYRSMAESAFKDNFVDGQIKIKKLFYVLRTLLACRWIEHTQTQPPTEFDKLVAADWVSPDEKSWIAELLKRKAVAVEAEPMALDERRSVALVVEIAEHTSAVVALRKQVMARCSVLDVLLRSWVSA
jgi:uncharacterized protein